MGRRSAQILFGIFITSVTFLPLVEAGHEILHAFQNPFHHHQLRDWADSKNHTIADHNFPKMKFAYEMDEPSSPGSLIVLAYFFFHPLTEYNFTGNAGARPVYFESTESKYLVYFRPPTPPPLSLTSS